MERGEIYPNWARQFFFFQSVAVTLRMQKFPQQHFRFGICAADAAHIIAALLNRMYVTHIGIQMYQEMLTHPATLNRSPPSLHRREGKRIVDAQG